MVVRGKLRGNGWQLASYLLKKADNDNIRLFDIRGTGEKTNLHQSLVEMSLTSELTKSDKGLYHIQICPAYGEDKQMNDADWFRAVDIMEVEIGYEGQKRAIVLHEKNGKIHAHVVWERYDHEKGIMKPNKFSRLAQDRARQLMEKEFGHVRTPERNKHQPEMKEILTEIWRKTDNADEFVKTLLDAGYVVATGTQRPYIVVDQTGRSFDLVRQLEGVKTKEVRDRFKATRLVKEKEAIANCRKSSQAESIRKARMTMNLSFIVESERTDKEAQLSFIIEKMDAKEALKKKTSEKLKRERLLKAIAFRENERDQQR